MRQLILILIKNESQKKKIITKERHSTKPKTKTLQSCGIKTKHYYRSNRINYGGLWIPHSDIEQCTRLTSALSRHLCKSAANMALYVCLGDWVYATFRVQLSALVFVVTILATHNAFCCLPVALSVRPSVTHPLGCRWLSVWRRRSANDNRSAERLWLCCAEAFVF